MSTAQRTPKQRSLRNISESWLQNESGLYLESVSRLPFANPLGTQSFCFPWKIFLWPFKVLSFWRAKTCIISAFHTIGLGHDTAPTFPATYYEAVHLETEGSLHTIDCLSTERASSSQSRAEVAASGTEKSTVSCSVSNIHIFFFPRQKRKKKI